MNKFMLSFSILIIFGCQLLAQTTITGTIVHGGATRNYRLHLPPNHDVNEPIPLVFNMHGFTSNATEQEIYSGMNVIADTAKFAVCYPNGISNAWNVGWAFGSFADDVGFISALIDDLSSKYGFDTNKIYACGMSNGGFMSYRLACELNNKIAAIASVTGSMVQKAIDACKPGRPVPVMEFHGTADPVVNYNGTLAVSEAISKVLALWQQNNGCDVEPIKEPIPNINASDNTTTEKWTYNNCAQDRKLVHFKVTNGGHTWPGSAINNGVTSQDFNASEEIWLFFKQYTLDFTQDVNGSEIEKISVFPNPTTDMIRVTAPNTRSITILDVNGMQVLKTDEPLHDGMISLSTLASGVYFVNVVTNVNNQTFKIVKI